MLYFIFEGKELKAETDNLEFAKSFVKKHSECTVKDAKTGKEVKIK